MRIGLAQRAGGVFTAEAGSDDDDSVLSLFGHHFTLLVPLDKTAEQAPEVRISVMMMITKAGCHIRFGHLVA
ncbi:hypothetical protein ACQP2E_09235 [Actinoplanes sp. CA-015351]|uniref:hypothetical protein n=1 Tax=Actinoplanes sp. CA-015351 TaxID=3239897 RepID=UPI003D976CB0